MDTPAFLDHLRKLPFYHDQIVHREYIPPREARHQQLEKPLQPALQTALEASHLFPLYSHQAAAHVANVVRRLWRIYARYGSSHA
ncbi:hypothetical protein M1O20_00525 [Dehalococcoidia bacterium]|nr:hypothetical protein [Dehalococcoidia bacterium]